MPSANAPACSPCRGFGEPGLADPRRADDRDEAVLADALAECVDVVLPAEQLSIPAVGAAASAPLARRGRCGLGRCRTLARHREAIAPAGNGGDRLRPEQLAQGGDLHLQVVLFDDEARPREVEQLLLGDQLAGAFGERHEHVERACADRDRSAADNEAALHGLQHEGIEAEGVGGHTRIRNVVGTVSVRHREGHSGSIAARAWWRPREPGISHSLGAGSGRQCEFDPG